MGELKPCPFCGNEKVYVVNFGGGSGRKDWRVMCEKCFTAFDFSQRLFGRNAFLTKKETIEAWNRRYD